MQKLTHPECAAGYRCIGNFLPEEIPELETKYGTGSIDVGMTPYNHDGTPKSEAELAELPNLKPVFVREATASARAG